MLKIEALTHVYPGGVRALDAVSLDVPRGMCAARSATCRRTSASIHECQPYEMLDHMAVLKGISQRSERRETVEALLHQVNLWVVRKNALAWFRAECASGSASRRR
jgi:ABC-2 type transport system ATP-binding protein